MAYYEQQQKFTEMAIPAILIILVAVVVGAKVFNICPPVIGEFLCGAPAIKTMILTSEQDFADAKAFATDVSSRVTKITPNVDPNILQHIKLGSLTSGQDYDIIVLYGDNTALTAEARKELTNYVNKGGSLMIVKGAGMKGLNTDGTTSDYVFGWSVDDLASLIKFMPDCQQIQTCSSVNQITVTPGEMSKVTMTPVQYDHPIVKRIGLVAPLEIDIAKYDNFKGVVMVEDVENKKIAWLDWFDANGKPHAAPAIIAYQAGAGGRIVYLAYNPIELNQEDLFRNLIQWTAKQT
jgi:hypothetical protein